MSLVGREGVQIGRIRRAGLSRVRDAAYKAGVSPERWTQDREILKAVASSSVATAAEKCVVTRSAVRYALKKYEKIALAILDADRLRSRNDSARAGGGNTWS